ncbi:MAG: divergent PAP2 family protein [Oscillospiraceae bacterium]|nr:divergent PAP2 family protein [Oscillospiraceae bacterium]
MGWFIEIVTNPYVVAGVTSWLLAQVAKLFIYWIVNKKFDIMRLFGDGGMPSGHSATVVSVATTCAFLNGFASFEFAISFILAIIVCHDATGVRLETGKQAVLIKEIASIIEKIADHKVSDDVKLKEFVGHTVAQVIIGSLLGAANATILCLTIFG